MCVCDPCLHGKCLEQGPFQTLLESIDYNVSSNMNLACVKTAFCGEWTGSHPSGNANPRTYAQIQCRDKSWNLDFTLKKQGIKHDSAGIGNNFLKAVDRNAEAHESAINELDGIINEISFL